MQRLRRGGSQGSPRPRPRVSPLRARSGPRRQRSAKHCKTAGARPSGRAEQWAARRTEKPLPRAIAQGGELSRTAARPGQDRASSPPLRRQVFLRHTLQPRERRRGRRLVQGMAELHRERVVIVLKHVRVAHRATCAGIPHPTLAAGAADHVEGRRVERRVLGMDRPVVVERVGAWDEPAPRAALNAIGVRREGVGLRRAGGRHGPSSLSVG